MKLLAFATLIAGLSAAAWADPLGHESLQPPRTANDAMGRVVLHTLAPIGLGALVAAGAPEPGDVIGGVAVAYGLFVGPSMGNYYLGDINGGTLGIVSRGVGGGMMLLGAAMAVGCALNGLDGDDETSGCSLSAPVLLFAGGGLTFLGGTIWNLSRLPKAARRLEPDDYSAHRPPVVRLTAAPTWNRLNKAIGLQVAYSY